MYVPAFTSVDLDAARSMVADIATGWLVTGSADASPAATLMPILWHDDRIIAHMAKANPHWRSIAEGMPALIIVTGPQAYVSPSWYPAKAEHGRVVPTWNYTAVHLIGRVYLRHDAEWKLRAVSSLTDRHESSREHPWHVTDAPDDYIATQLNAIVGIEMLIDSVEAKAKLSQNRSTADQQGVIDNLRNEPAQNSGPAEIADAMTSNLGE